MLLQTLPLILVGVALNSIAQLLLKQGMRTCRAIEYSLKGMMHFALDIMGNLFVVGGLVCYVVSVVLWLLVLSKVEVSVAYPLISLGYVFVAIAGYYFFDEAVSVQRILGILIIIFGVYLVSRTAM